MSASLRGLSRWWSSLLCCLTTLWGLLFETEGGHDTGKGGAEPWNTQLFPVPVHLQRGIFIFWGEAGTGGSTKEATTGIWKPFFATLSRLTLLLATRAAFCQLFLRLSSARSTPFRNINWGLGRISFSFGGGGGGWIIFPQPGSDYGGRRHSLWRCVRALRGHRQVSVALLLFLLLSFCSFSRWLSPPSEACPPLMFLKIWHTRSCTRSLKRPRARPQQAWQYLCRN